MAKPRIVYPDTATRFEQPLLALVNRIDPDFAKEHRFDVAYQFGRRVFKEDSMTHGAYAGLALGAEQGLDFVTEQGARLGPDTDPTLTAFLTRGRQDSPLEFGSDFVAGDFERFPDPYHLASAIDAQFKRDNGFLDPPDDGTVTTGTGAGGANPGAVPSIAAVKTEGGTLFRTEDGRTFLSPDPAPAVGVVFVGESAEFLYSDFDDGFRRV